MRLLIVGNPERTENARLEEEGRLLGHELTVIAMGDVVFDMNGEFRALVNGQDLRSAFDAVYVRNFFPLISEGLLLAELAHGAGLRVMDRSLATANYIQSKTYQAWKLGSEGIVMPSGFQTADRRQIRERLPELGYPLVVKGVHGSQGTHVHLCHDERDVEHLLDTHEDGFFSFQKLLEIKDEYRVLVLGGHALGAMLKQPPAGDFRHNISLGGTATPAELPDDLLKLCERSAKKLEYEFAGVDLALTRDGRTVILEVNRSPGFTGFEAATGMNVAREVVKYLAS
jgi:RimK family alpha-L-glutamate ligase